MVTYLDVGICLNIMRMGPAKTPYDTKNNESYQVKVNTNTNYSKKVKIHCRNRLRGK